MTEKLLKEVKKYGNSGGVYLPSSWVGGKVEVSLVKKPADPTRDLLEALSGNMEHIMGAFIYGSHARGEADEGSDIDVAVVADGHISSKDILLPSSAGYDLNVIEEKNAFKSAARDPIFRMMLGESKPVFNHALIDGLKSVPADLSGLKFRVGFSESALRINKSLREMGSSSELYYSLVMRIKEMLVIKCFLAGKKYSNSMLRGFLSSQGMSGDEISDSISTYRQARSGSKPGKQAHGGGEAADKLISALGKIIDDVKKQEAKKKHIINRTPA